MGSHTLLERWIYRAPVFLHECSDWTQLSEWLTCRMMHMQLSMGLPYSSVTRWAVCIDSAVGEPFLSTSKDYLVELVCQHQSVASAADLGPLRKRPKRQIKPRPASARACPRKRPGEGMS